MPTPMVLVHGGAGLYADGRFEEARLGCEAAARAALEVLLRAESALDAVAEAVRAMEDNPEFNAGTGSCLTSAGTIEMDACLMRGSDLRVGAVASVSGIRNPILAARVVMDRSPHALLCGEGARSFLLDSGVSPYPEAELITARARARFERDQPDAHGTVGAVALDVHGHLAAGTSTGGIHRKLPGRVGDSPIPGAGTFADDLTGAASATGLGEPILRIQLCRTAADLLAAGRGAQQAADASLEILKKRTGGTAGLILLSPQGQHAAAFTTPHMSWAWFDASGRSRSGCG